MFIDRTGTRSTQSMFATNYYANKRTSTRAAVLWRAHGTAKKKFMTILADFESFSILSSLSPVALRRCVTNTIKEQKRNNKTYDLFEALEFLISPAFCAAVMLAWHLNHSELASARAFNHLPWQSRLIDKIIKSSFTLLSLIQFIICAAAPRDTPKSRADVFGSWKKHSITVHVSWRFLYGNFFIQNAFWRANSRRSQLAWKIFILKSSCQREWRREISEFSARRLEC